MAVAFDATFLMLMLDPLARASEDPTTKKVVSDVETRIAYLISSIEKSGQKIIIPTPALSEVLIGADDKGPDYLAIIYKRACFQIKGFDIRAAIEVAAVTRRAIDEGDKKSKSTDSWQKVKFDRQIIAIAKVNGADKVYSDDQGIANFANHAGIKIEKIVDLPLPPENPQQSLDFEKNNQ